MNNRPNNIRPILNPKLWNGAGNWLQMQKHIKSVDNANSSSLCKNSQKYKPKDILEETLYSKDKRIKQMQNNSSNMCDSFRSHSKLKKKKSKKNKSSLKNYDNQEQIISSDTISKVDKIVKKNHPTDFKFNFVNNGAPNEEVTEEIVPEEQDISNEYINGKRITKAIAMDCEMVGTGPNGSESIIARVSIVNTFGECLYDEFVKPKLKVTDYRTRISGVRPKDLENAKDLYDVQKDIVPIIEGRILVGHDLKHDLKVLFISHPHSKIRDTSKYKDFRSLCGGRTPSLKKLTQVLLNTEIQCGEHSSVVDAQATMQLYLMHKREWEQQIKSHRKKMKTKNKLNKKS